MPVDPALVDRIAGTIADLYLDAENALIRAIAERLRAELDTTPAEADKLAAIRRLQAAARSIYERLQAAKGAAIRRAIADAYASGTASAMAELPPSARLRQGARQALDDVPNAATVARIATAVHRDLGRVEANILRAPIDAYRAVQAATAARIATGVATRRQASQAAWQRLVEQGIVSFVDRRGRRWRLSSYAEMIARTNVQRAATQGQTDRLAALGEDLVIVSDSPRECPKCRPFERKVISISGRHRGRIRVEHATRDGEYVEVNVVATLAEARSRGLQHPNCTHSLSAYRPGITKTGNARSDPDGYEAAQRQRYIERKIRTWKEHEQAALTPEARKAARAKIRDWQRIMREHLAANPALKRLPYREQIGAGSQPPRGRGAPGGPVTPIEPPPQLPPTPRLR